MAITEQAPEIITAHPVDGEPELTFEDDAVFSVGCDFCDARSTRPQPTKGMARKAAREKDGFATAAAPGGASDWCGMATCPEGAIQFTQFEADGVEISGGPGHNV